ncbi:MAG: GNAT family N-acetyltransferase [Myxococcaceae bacterium]|jgi:ribosomal protein S18 acetylase RimI-like enzyme|nr:GNAT family N-acetyltransferase [Myxococcaceae bacterium]
MRRREYEAPIELAHELFRDVEAMQVAGTSADGEVLLKTVHGVVDDGWVCFHSAPAGEKTSMLGRTVVVSVEETITRLPSWFFDAERACPATTLFRGAQARGVLTEVVDPTRKARVLQRLMEKLQPDGGYVPIEAGAPLYRVAVKGLLIAGVPLAGATAKAKLAQNRSDEARVKVLELLWRRGLAGDARAIELLREANPTTPTPGFLRHAHGVTLVASLDRRALAEVVELLRGTSWNAGVSESALRRAHLESQAWVGARSADGQLIGTARALSDGGKTAWIFDVCVREDWRRRGVGQALMRLVLDHPSVRSCRRVRLGTRDAQALYERFGFVDLGRVVRPYPTTEMLLER